VHGLADPTANYRDTTWWQNGNIEAYERLVSEHNAKSRTATHTIKQESVDSAWLERTKAIFQSMEDASPDFVKPPPFAARPLKAGKPRVADSVSNNRALRSQGGTSTQTSPDKPAARKAIEVASSVPGTAPIFGQMSMPESVMPVPPVQTASSAPPAAVPSTEAKRAPLIRFTFKAGQEVRLARESQVNGKKDAEE
jgi:hypothetical protein